MKDAPIVLTTQEIPRVWGVLSPTVDPIYVSYKSQNYTHILTFKVLLFKEMLTNIERRYSVMSG